MEKAAHLAEKSAHLIVSHNVLLLGSLCMSLYGSYSSHEFLCKGTMVSTGIIREGKLTTIFENIF